MVLHSVHAGSVCELHSMYVNSLDSRAIFRVDMGVYIGTILWPLLMA